MVCAAGVGGVLKMVQQKASAGGSSASQPDSPDTCEGRFQMLSANSNRLCRISLAILLGMIVLSLPPNSRASARPSPSKAFVVRAGLLTLRISSSGEITSVSLSKKWTRKVAGRTNLEGCTVKGPSQVRVLPGGAVEVQKTFESDDGRYRCAVTDRFIPDGQAIRWEVAAEGSESTWSTGITTSLVFPETVKTRFWTAWGSPGHLTPADWGGERLEWHNPFETRPFRNLHLVYGGHFGKGAGYSLPVFSVMNDVVGSGIALAMSPEDPLLDVHMITTTSGEVSQTRRFNRLEKGKPVSFRMHIFAHEPDWRPVVAFMVERYSRFFEPPLANALELCGLGAYSSYEGEIDVHKYEAMGGIVNWKASFDFSYMGMFIPPVDSDTTRWKRFDVTSEGEPIRGKVTYSSIAQMRQYARTMKELNFATLNYFNVTEFGGSSDFSPKVVYPLPEFRSGEQTWTNPSAFLYKRFPGAILFGALDHVGWHKRTPEQHMNSPVRLHDEPFWTWGGAIATDVGDSAYAAFLLDQARLHVEKIPDAQGICIDRLDWLNEYNWRADDGTSWLDGRPVRSLLNSFKAFIPRLSSVMHGNGRAMFCNPHMNRLEMMEYFDGIYNEFGHIGHNLNLSAFLCLFKPLLCWTPDRQTVMESPDAYFQHHLLMGAFPTAPFPGNDHTVQPEPEVERHYLNYGTMFRLMRGRRWVLLPRVIEVTKGSALANIFLKRKNEVVIPVMMGSGESANVTLRHCKKLLGVSSVVIQIWHPGKTQPLRTQQTVRGDSLSLSVPLQSGCAFVSVTTV
jgi:hypothetical protein